jgi:hypothetical protein
MATITTAPGLLTIDPIQGLVDYVKDIKPFHTKIFQVLYEYVYTDAVNTTVTDTMEWFIDDNETYITWPTDPSLPNPGGIAANSFWYNSTSGTLYLRGNYLNPQFQAGSNVLRLAGNYTNLFVLGFVFNISGTGTVNDGDYTVAVSTFDGVNTVLTTTPNPINGTPGAASFVAAPLSFGTLYWNGHQLFTVNGTNQTLIPNVLASTSPPPYGSTAAYWYNPANNQLYSWNGTAYTPAVLSTGIMGYWIQFLTQLGANPNPSSNTDTSVTEFMETIAFDWSGNYSYLIVGQNLGNNQVSIPGNLIYALMAQDITQIDSHISFITAVAYDSGTDTTVVTMDTVPPSITVATLIVQDIDITYWYQWAILSANPVPTAPSQSSSVAGIGQPIYMPPSVPAAVQFSPQQSTNALVLSINGNVVVPSITVSGNATTSVQVGALFRVNGSPSNDGVYYAVYVQYEPIANTTTIGVAATTGVPAPVLISTGGGFINPYRFVAEAQQGSYDNSGYDKGPYDQSAGSIIYQGP